MPSFGCDNVPIYYFELCCIHNVLCIVCCVIFTEQCVMCSLQYEPNSVKCAIPSRAIKSNNAITVVKSLALRPLAALAGLANLLQASKNLLGLAIYLRAGNLSTLGNLSKAEKSLLVGKIFLSYFGQSFLGWELSPRKDYIFQGFNNSQAGQSFLSISLWFRVQVGPILGLFKCSFIPSQILFYRLSVTTTTY